jgi:hypothetical protein
MADRVIKPDSGNQLVLQDEGGDSALSIDTSGNTQIASGKRIETDEVRAQGASGLKLYDDGGNGILVEDGGFVGINISNPTSPLHVDSSEASTYAADIENTSSTGHGLKVKAGDTIDHNILALHDYSDAQMFVVRGSGLVYSDPTHDNGQGGSPRQVTIEDGGQMGSQASSRRFKTNIEDLVSIILLDKLRPVSFNYYEKDKATNTWSETEVNRYNQIGLIAEEVRDVLTELGAEENSTLFGVDKTGEPDYVNYLGFIPYLIKGYQDLLKKINELEKKIG